MRKTTMNPGSLTLSQLRALATLEVISARRSYIELASTDAGTDVEISAAWFRLWCAEEYQRQLDDTLSRPEINDSNRTAAKYC